MRSRLTRLGLLAVELGVPVALLGVAWWWTSTADEFFYPPLGDVLTTFRRTWLFDQLGSDVIPSLYRLGAGFAIACCVGVSLGLVLGQSRIARAMFAPTLELLRALPSPALIPFFILVLGVGDLSKVLLIASVCVWPVLLNTIDGVRAIESVLQETGRTYRIRPLLALTHVTIPAASPQIFAGMRTALPLALILMVISEMVASTNGLGRFILQSQSTFDIPAMWSGILLLGLLGYLLNAGFLLIERRVLRWHRAARRKENAP